jgi:hypothetical protein
MIFLLELLTEKCYLCFEGKVLPMFRRYILFSSSPLHLFSPSPVLPLSFSTGKTNIREADVDAGSAFAKASADYPPLPLVQ